MKTESIYRENIVYYSHFTWGLLWLVTRTHHTRVDINSQHRTMFTTQLMRTASITLVFMLPTCRLSARCGNHEWGARSMWCIKKKFQCRQMLCSGSCWETLSVKGNNNGEVFPDELRTQQGMRRGRRKGRGEEMRGGRRRRHQVDEKHNTTARNALLSLLCCWTVIGSTGQSTWVVGGRGWCSDLYSTSQL